MTCGSDRAGTFAALAMLVFLVPAANASPADDAFKQGRDLFKAGKYAEACTAFGESQRLDPSLGTQFNIAQCEEKIGKLASALKIYRDLVQYDTNGVRKAAASDLAAKLEPRVPKLQLQLNAKPAGTVIALDGVECGICLTGNAPVDFGTIKITVKAPGWKPATASATIAEESKVIVVQVKLEPVAVAGAVVTPPVVVVAAKPDPTPEPIAPSSDTPPRSKRKLAAVVTLAGAGVFVGTGIVFGAMARSRWQDAKDACGGGTSCANDSDTQYAQDLGDSARTRANVSTVMFVAGGLAAAAGVYLWVTTPKEHAVTVSATATPGTAGLVLAGQF